MIKEMKGIAKRELVLIIRALEIYLDTYQNTLEFDDEDMAIIEKLIKKLKK